MNYTDEQIIAYLENDLDAATRREIADWIASTADAQQRVAELQQLEAMFADSVSYTPPAELLYSFREKIAEERDQATTRTRWYQIAAAVLLMIAGFGTGRLTINTGQQAVEYGELKQEVHVLQQLVMMNALRDHSASERLQAINMIEESPVAADAELVSALVQTMNNDASPNVRFAAVQALIRFINEEQVRTQMIRTLGEQDDPLVQIAIINALVTVQEKEAIAPITKIAINENAPAEVRRTAEMALDILI